MTNKVSVIIPTYNRSKLVKEAIDSVLNQTFKDFELLIVDDGSADDTKTIIEQYGDKLSYYLTKHKGVSAARNFGIKKSCGEYLTFLDSDDLWKKDKLKKQIQFFDKNPEAKICYTDEIWYRDGVRVNPRKKHYKPSGDVFLELLPFCRISASSIMVKREIIGALYHSPVPDPDSGAYRGNGTGSGTGLSPNEIFDENLPVCEDYDLWLRMSIKYPIYFIDIPLIIKRNRLGENLSQMYWGMDRFRVRSLEKILKMELDDIYKKEAIKELLVKLNILCNGSWKRGRMLQFLKYFSKYLYFKLILGGMKEDGKGLKERI